MLCHVSVPILNMVGALLRGLLSRRAVDRKSLDTTVKGGAKAKVLVSKEENIAIEAGRSEYSC